MGDITKKELKETPLFAALAPEVLAKLQAIIARIEYRDGR